MKAVTALEAKTRLGQVLEAAQREPLAITKNGRPCVVMMSMKDYERSRARNWQQVMAVSEQASVSAAERGLEIRTLGELLDHER